MSTGNPYSDNLDVIQAVLAHICRRKRLNAYDRDEFTSWTHEKLLENSALLASFEGRSDFKTFLVIVIQNKYKDWLDHERGRFRTSTEAARLGPLAVELEQLVYRDRIDYEQAVQLLISRGVAESVAQCDEIWEKLNNRKRREFVNLDDVTLSHPVQEDPVDREERLRLGLKVRRAMYTALSQLPDQDRLLFRMRYWDAVTVAAIAAMRGVDQKALYRRYGQLARQLRTAMLEAGITEDDVRRLFEEFGIDPEEDGGGGGNGK